MERQRGPSRAGSRRYLTFRLLSPADLDSLRHAESRCRQARMLQELTSHVAFIRFSFLYAFLPAAPRRAAPHITSRVHTSHSGFHTTHGRVFFSLSASDSQSVGFPKGVTKARRRRRSPERAICKRHASFATRLPARATRRSSAPPRFPAAFLPPFFHHPAFVLKFILRACRRARSPDCNERAVSVPTRTISPDNIEANCTRNPFSHYEMTAA